ncbi:hypothetical protein WA026_011047 [Henosepilachna vigintioctopunctata]|uniref:Fatty acyl-CoA reductase n=1 Tax=Henosepilachna vigintioctopunctata TaxID=420089 RepID=A0AAW1U722_9CUCU
MSSCDGKSKYPPRAYKNISELKRGNDISDADIKLLTVTDERVHASTKGSEIVEFFNGKSIFITGGTGFVGKLLTEKLLRTCKDIDTIYLIVRYKKGKSPEERLIEIFSDKIFSELEKTQPKFRNRIIPITGDISLPQLGINDAERQILVHKVNVIFHAAATVRFDEKLRLATAINIVGTRELMDLAHECHNLSSLVYVSTAFSNCPNEQINEEIYNTRYSVEELLKIINTKSDRHLDNNTAEICGKWPNTYTFTKAIAENIVQENRKGVTTCIFRPGIITSTYKEPLKSWIDNLYGPMGAVVGVGTGVLRSFHCDAEKVADIVPADYVINGIIAAAYQNNLKRQGELTIYNYVSSPENPLTWGDFQDLAIHYGMRTPSIKSVWYCCNTINKHYYIHLAYIIFLHFIPAYFLDLYLKVIGKRTKVVKIYKKIHKFNSALSLFSTNEWTFRNDNTVSLWNSLSKIDKKIFCFSLAPEHFNWNDYLSNLGGGVRLYLLKEDFSTIPAATAKYKRLYYYHKMFQAVCVTIVSMILYWIFSPIYF